VIFNALKPKLRTGLKVVSIILVLCLFGYILNYFLWGDNTNRISRLGVSYLDGDYTVVYHAYSGDKVWIVNSGKITTEADKGYYFFWASVEGTDKKAYVQIPILATTIEQIVKAN
jgi:hypothetical protein